MVSCEPNHQDLVIDILINEGWLKDTNMHELTMSGKVKFLMYRNFK